MADHPIDRGGSPDGILRVELFQFYGEQTVTIDLVDGDTSAHLTAEQARAVAADLVKHANLQDGGRSEMTSTMPELARIPLLAVLPWAARLTVDQRHEMLEAAATAEDPAATIEEWRTAALGGPDAEQVDLRFSPKEMRDLRRIAREQDTTVDELIRAWLLERIQPKLPTSINTPGAITINMGPPPTDPPPGINMGMARAMYERGRQQGRYEAGR